MKLMQPEGGYIVVEAGNLQNLVAAVQKAISYGYVPQGGVSTYGMTYIQAMIREVKE